MKPEEATAKVRARLNLRAWHVVVAVLAVFVVAVVARPRNAQAYQYTCGAPPAPLTTVEKVTGVTVPEGRRVFIARGIAGDGTGLGAGSTPITEVPLCTSNDPLFEPEGNLLVAVDGGGTVYFWSAVVAYLDNVPLTEAPQP